MQAVRRKKRNFNIYFSFQVLERRYPVTTEAFQLRKGSGGVGRHPGGDGVLRELAFHEPMTVSVLCERRSFRPRGEQHETSRVEQRGYYCNRGTAKWHSR